MPTYKVTVRIQIEWEDEIEAETPEVAEDLAKVAARYNGTVIHTESMYEEVSNDLA